jgi:hypothetical protein
MIDPSRFNDWEFVRLKRYKKCRVFIASPPNSQAYFCIVCAPNTSKISLTNTKGEGDETIEESIERAKDLIDKYVIT